MVATQLTGQMAISAYVSNSRTANGGDISVGVANRNTPLKQSDLVFFEQLKHAKTISDYTPVNLNIGSIGNTPPPLSGLLVQIIDPQHFPLVSAPTFISPSSGSLATLLTDNQVVVTQTFLTYYHKQLGDTFDLQIQSYWC
ncbi:hypothetical protein KSZ_76170 [Dictyobacter formicarum]|uniref:Uncharacterized protein n=1 Tax=Dictyobacter formicarum TaxID=2778368 RepID=A0ABQ3VX35_9CHLR|nr:hypothetical protein KSZ_76170 [Dictyobacter formicarum]